MEKLVLVNWHSVVWFAMPCIFLIVIITRLVPQGICVLNWSLYQNELSSTYMCLYFSCCPLYIFFLTWSLVLVLCLLVFIFHSFREIQLSYLCNTFLHEYRGESAVNLVFCMRATVDLVADHMKLYRRKVPPGSWITSSKNCQHFAACFCQLLQIFLALGRDRFVT